jgi:hypothetical protein
MKIVNLGFMNLEYETDEEGDCIIDTINYICVFCNTEFGNSIKDGLLHYSNCPSIVNGCN